eukprot:scaffold28403_cov112-Isochrysis_galbana.AAC.3
MDPSRLDCATPPPAAALDVNARLAADQEVRQRAILASAGARLPRARLLVGLVHAALALHEARVACPLADGGLDVVEVRRLLGQNLGRDVGDVAARRGVERRRESGALVPVSAGGWAPTTHIPARRLRQDRARRAKQWGWRSIPLSARGGDYDHVRIDLALQLRRRDRLTCLRVDSLAAGVILVALSQLAARGSGWVNFPAGAAPLSDHVDGVLRAPIVLVARVVLDGLLHGLREECGQVGKPVVAGVASPGRSSEECAAADADRRHLFDCLDHVNPEHDDTADSIVHEAAAVFCSLRNVWEIERSTSTSASASTVPPPLLAGGGGGTATDSGGGGGGEVDTAPGRGGDTASRSGDSDGDKPGGGGLAADGKPAWPKAALAAASSTPALSSEASHHIMPARPIDLA